MRMPSVLSALGLSFCAACGAPASLDAAAGAQSQAFAPPTGPTCSVKLDPGPQWDSGGWHHQLLSVEVSNITDTLISVPWTLTLVSANYTAIDNAWNWNAEVKRGGFVEGRATATWQTLYPGAANTVTVGGAFASPQKDLSPTSVLLNGVPCLIESP